MNPTENNIHHDTPISNSFGMHENSLLLSTPLVPSDYSVSPLKGNCEILRNGSNAEYLQKNEFMPEIATDMTLNVDFGHEHRYRDIRQLNAPTSSYELKTLNHDIPSMSFTDELRSLNRETSSISSFNYYQKNISPGPDIYNQEFPSDFTNSNFSTSLPSTSAIFPTDDNPSCYVISETQPDEMLLNGIELNEPEKLISLLSSEELGAATRHGSCFEVILNNGEVLYAILDSESEYGSSMKLMQIPKEMLVPERHCSLPVPMDSSITDQLTQPQYESNINASSSFPSKSPVENFDVNSRNYHSVISTSLSKTINSSSISSESFNLCCDFPATDNANQFPADMSRYSTMVSKAHSPFDESSLPKSEITYTCASANSSTKQISVIQEEPKITSSTAVSQSEPKIDYFPSAVNSIVVSETGKKYPKKYSFYSNNFSSFLNQESSFDKDCRKSDINTSSLSCTASVTTDEQVLTEINQQVCSSITPVPSNGSSDNLISASASPRTNLHSIGQMTDTMKSNSSVPVAAKTAHVPANESESYYHINLADNEDEVAESNDFISSNLLDEEQNMKNKFLNSRLSTALNSICDRAVQSRARATLPMTYLSINRIKNESTNNEKPTYGVFARQTIPGRTQFGPIEGVLVKTEEDEEDECKEDSNNVLQLTVEGSDSKFWRLDVSNEDMSNWMRFVRPATTYKEQNLMLSQQGPSLYFTTIEVIHPKQELLVWYGAAYSRIRNYKLLEDDPCANILYDVIEGVNDLSIILTSNKNTDAEKTKLTENETTFNGADNDKSIAVTQVISKQNSKVTKKPSIEVPSKKATTKKNDKLNKSLWLCDYCDLTFSNGAVMNLHVLAHTDYEADAETAAAVPTMKDDNVTLDSQEFTCPQCSQDFNVRKELISHVSKHGLKVQRWTDNKTNELSSNEDTKQEKDDIEEASATKKFQCQFCKKVLKNSIALNIHERIHSENSFLECPICDATFEKLTAMKEHVHTHAKNGIFKCPHCPKTYDRYKVIRKHIRSVHVTAKYVCKQCKKCFRSQYKLRSHMLKHSDNREFLCANCGKQFKRIDKLTEHIRNIHSEERERRNMEIMNNALANKANKKMLKKKLPNKVLRLITENVNDYFYKCYICNIGFKRRGMLVNHINTFHPNVSLDTIPELNVPILKAYCNFFCLYCDRVYKSNSKRKAHIIKSHPGAKIPGNSERGNMLNDPYAKHVKDVILDPFNCEYCYRQYASRAKLLSHHRKDHADLIPSDKKLPRSWNSQKKKRKSEVKKIENEVENCNSEQPQQNPTANTENNLELHSMEFEIGNTSSTSVNMNTSQVVALQINTKENTSDSNQVTNFQQLLNEELRNSISQEQYLKILQSFNGIAIAQTDENSSAILQQIITSYSFPSS